MESQTRRLRDQRLEARRIVEAGNLDEDTVFATGFAEFDQAWGVATRALVKSLAPEAIDSLELALADPAKSEAVAKAIDAIAPEGTLVTDWKELNRELFAALRLQQLALFLLLGLIVLVSTFNVASTPGAKATSLAW